nr:dual specificity protein phosphatase family protein [Halobiforma haloterrestris]
MLIHCKAGISRSSTLVATAIAAEEDRRFREALRIVQEARPFAMPNPALHELAVVYLAANG